MPLVDPQLVHQAFEQIQQVRVLLLGAPTCSTSTATRSTAPTGRSCSASASSTRPASPTTTSNWSNLHTVYTHGNGVIAAFANQRPADNGAESTEIQWAEGQQPGQDALPTATGGYESRIYFGEQQPRLLRSSARPPGRPTSSSTSTATADTQRRTTTYAGKGGVAGRQLRSTS